MLLPTVSRPVSLRVNPHLGPKTRFLLLSDSCGFVDMRPPLSNVRTDLTVANPAGPHQHSHSLVRVPQDSSLNFSVWDSRLHQPGGLGPRIYIPQEQGGPVIPPGTWFPILRRFRVTVEVFEPAPTQASITTIFLSQLHSLRADNIADNASNSFLSLLGRDRTENQLLRVLSLPDKQISTELFPNNGCCTVVSLHSCYLTMSLHIL
jgi:hypothetical protein